MQAIFPASRVFALPEVAVGDLVEQARVVVQRSDMACDFDR